jgi:hypothetical protein
VTATRLSAVIRVFYSRLNYNENLQRTESVLDRGQNGAGVVRALEYAGCESGRNEQGCSFSAPYGLTKLTGGRRRAVGRSRFALPRASSALLQQMRWTVPHEVDSLQPSEAMGTASSDPWAIRPYACTSRRLALAITVMPLSVITESGSFSIDLGQVGVVTGNGDHLSSALRAEHPDHRGQRTIRMIS